MRARWMQGGAASLVAAIIMATATADVIYLTNGDALIGELVEETHDYVRFKTRMNNVVTTLKYKWGRVDRIEREPGDQMAESAAPEQAPVAADPTAARPKLPGRERIVVIPLHGSVGVMDGRFSNGFDAAMLRIQFERAKAEQADVVVLEVKSPGGLVSEMEAICNLIIEYHDALRIVAFVREAFSAAAIISLSCKELVMVPEGRIGAAVIVNRGPRGMSAVDAKMASPHYARQRAYMTASGKPYEVVAAMTIQETALWWNAERGFTTDESDLTPARRLDRVEWTQLDQRTTVLTLLGTECDEYGLADALATTPVRLGRALDIGRHPEILSYDNEIRAYQAERQVAFDAFVKDVETYFRSIGVVHAGLVEYLSAAQGQNKEAARKASAKTNRGARAASSAGSRIRRSGRDVVERRFEIPDEFYRRLSADAKLLRTISALLRAGTEKSLGVAIDRFNEVVNEWNRLLGNIEPPPRNPGGRRP